MGFMDAINPEATTTIKVSDLAAILKEAAEYKAMYKYLFNGIKAEVPHKYIREIASGEKEEKNTKTAPVIASANAEINASEFA